MTKQRKPGGVVVVSEPCGCRACGKQVGRPRRIVNRDEIRELRSASLRQIAAKLGVGYGTVRLRLQQFSNSQEVVE